MEQRIEQLEKTVSDLQAEIATLKKVIASGYSKVDSNFDSVRLSVGLYLNNLAEEISKVADVREVSPR